MSDTNPESRIPNPGDDPISYLFGLEFHGHKLGLENIRVLVGALGHPERAFKALHIAGTNGKGSVAAFCAAALSAAGYRTGCYTSPHLTSIEERFRIDGAPVGRSELEAVVDDIRRAAAPLADAGTLRAAPTFFEVATAAAFLLFRNRKVDVAVLEVGLGGRLDATNVAQPGVGAITTVDLDHERHLGSTIADIALEKAGIIKPGMTIVSGERKREAAAVIEAACLERGARLVRAFDDTEIDLIGWSPESAGRAVVRLTTPAAAYPPVTLSLRGRHQVDNAVVAVRALEAMAGAGARVPPDAIVQGLGSAVWPGRLELVRTTGGASILLDGAHNPAGARTLGAFLAEFFGQGVALVFGAVQDKDHRAILRELLPHARAAVLTAPDTHRAAPADELRSMVRELSPDLPAIAAASPGDALERALETGFPVCVAGSIYLLGALGPTVARLRAE